MQLSEIRWMGDSTMPGQSLVRKSLLLLGTATAAAVAFLGGPIKRAVAAVPTINSGPAINRARPPLVVRQVKVSPTAVRLMQIAGRALSDQGLAERIYRDPEGVGRQFQLSANELLVLRHMDRADFSVARSDAARLVAERMNSGQPMPPGATNTLQITEGMIVGRAILAAVGIDYRTGFTAKCPTCCPWGGSLEIGVGGDPGTYRAAFARRAAGQ
jgi:hypothetical protein